MYKKINKFFNNKLKKKKVIKEINLGRHFIVKLYLEMLIYIF